MAVTMICFLPIGMTLMMEFFCSRYDAISFGLMIDVRNHFASSIQFHVQR
ncbi:hypothetical protein PAV_3c01820 [Paenibacillus alvei DSM 29]|nr:hypothetical protein PAV_3c01820 [Paenibacillus alvei DSM 29]